jgi:hypothetical protein
VPLTNQQGVIQTFQQAEAQRVQRLSIARNRRVPDPLGVIEEATNRHTYHIFNVGPWPQQINTGSIWGFFRVPGCPKNKEYVEANRSIPGIVSELTIKDEYEYNRLMSDGWKFALELVGIGRGRDPKRALTHYGLFASKNVVPTKAELFQAKTLLHATCSDIVREARDVYATDRKAFSVIVKRNRHFAAAEVLNLTDEPWMVEQSPSQRVKCRYCMTMNDDQAIICSKCMKPIDMAKFKALEQQDAEYLAAEETELPRRTRPDVAERNRQRALGREE